MNERDKILVQLLGATHAIWIPTRTWNLKLPTNVYFARERFRQCGVRWASGERSGAAQQAASRAMSALRRDGLITSTRPAGVKTLYGKLTDRGETRACALADSPGLVDALDSLTALAALESTPDALPSGWVSEGLLLGWTDQTRPTDLHEFRMATGELTTEFFWGLTREWLQATSDVSGSAYYRLTPAGRAILADPPAIPKRLPKFDEAAAELYNESRKASRQEIFQADEPDAEIGDCPLSCSPTTRRMVAERERITAAPTA